MHLRQIIFAVTFAVMENEHPLKTWRIEQRMTLIELGAKLGVKAPHLSLIEARKRRCSLDLAIRTWRLTGIPIEQLAGASAADASN